jgi:LPXTG-motif cell wall-anchored protein
VVLLAFVTPLWLSTDADAAGSASPNGSVATSTVLSIVPSGPVGVDTPVVFRAVVTPADATGRVLFTFVQRGTAIAYAEIAGGTAEIDTTRHEIGTQVVTAQFVPASDSRYLTSTSKPLALVISTRPGLNLATSSGESLPPGSTVAPSQRVQARLEGFLPGSLATVSLDGVVLAAKVFVSSLGTATVLITIPSRLTVGVHLLAASSGDLSASLRLSSVSPGNAVIETPPSPTTSPIAVPSSTATAIAVSTGISGSGTGQALAQTGSDPIELTFLGLLLIGLGALVVRGTSTPVGAHSAARVRLVEMTGRHENA